MKFFTNLFLIFFISIAAYLLLNEKTLFTKSHRIKRIATTTGSTSKVANQTPTRDPYLFEIQRQRINNETIYKFQSNDNNESYDLHESDLEKFGMNFKASEINNKFKLKRESANQ